jgi:hypothetical protein
MQRHGRRRSAHHPHRTMRRVERPVRMAAGSALGSLSGHDRSDARFEALDLRIKALPPADAGRLVERAAPSALADRVVTVLDVYGSLPFAGARTLQTALPDPSGRDARGRAAPARPDPAGRDGVDRPRRLRRPPRRGRRSPVAQRRHRPLEHMRARGGSTRRGSRCSPRPPRSVRRAWRRSTRPRRGSASADRHHPDWVMRRAATSTSLAPRTRSLTGRPGAHHHEQAVQGQDQHRHP